MMVAALTAASMLISCRRVAPPSKPNLLLVTIDTLRADRLGCYGHSGAATPTLDRLAREGLRVAEAYAVAPITAPSHASILTGRLPLRHGVRTNGLYILAEEEQTLAETLSRAGWLTAAFVGGVPLDHRFGFAQGFAVYDDDFSKSVLRGKDLSPWYRIPLNERERRADEVVEPAIAWLEANARGKPFFLWVHLFDPHSPYHPPPPFDSGFYQGTNPRDPVDRSLDAIWREPREWHGWMRGITDAAYVRALYDGEVAFSDAQIARILAALDRLGLGAETVVAVTADHGEAFGEHGEWFFHGDLVHESAMKVPLLLRAPWRLAPGSVARVRARGVDLFPTLLEILAVAPIAPIDGESLLPAIDAESEELRPVLLEAAYRDRSGRGVFGYIEGRAKIVLRDPASGGAPSVDCYDLVADPRELRSLCAQGNSNFTEMRGRFDAMRRRLESPQAGASEIDPSVLDALESLGYVSH